MKIIVCGGAGEVGASCYLLQLDGRNILLDCGIRMRDTQDPLPDLRRIQELGGLDAIVISHAHLDHTGALPVISREYPQAPILMTHASQRLTRVLLYDSLKIMDRNEADIPIYAEKHVEETLDRVLCYSPQFPFPLGDTGVTATFYGAGHIAGAAMVYLQAAEGTLLYTGDFSASDQQTVSGAAIPRLRPDVLICESTYGANLHANRQIEEARLVDTVSHVVADGGKILFPAFALGRAQEIILLLKQALGRKQLPEVPIYADGMVRAINSVYQLEPNYLRRNLARKVFRGAELFYDDHIQAVTTNDMRKAILEQKDPACIIASSGMLKGGPSALYAEKLAAESRNFIGLTGYQDEEAPGREVLKLTEAPPEERWIKLNTRDIQLQCGLGTYALSAHADRGQLIGLVQRVTPRRVLLVHGDTDALAALAEQMQQEIPGRVYIPQNGEEYDWTVHKPRKQQQPANIPVLDEAAPLSAETIEQLWTHLIHNSSRGRAFAAEELLYIWHGRPPESDTQVQTTMKLLNDTPYFTPNTRRLFLYHPTPEDELVEDDASSGIMELNAMLSHVRALFPAEAGLYRVGAKVETQTVLLAFHFPAKAAIDYAEHLARIPAETGWQVEMNKDCHLAAAEERAAALLPADVTLEKLSYRRQERRMDVRVNKQPAGAAELEAEYERQTGIQLRILWPGQHDQGQQTEVSNQSRAPQPKGPRMEQNEALGYIEASLRSCASGQEPPRIFTKRVRGSGSSAYLELVFISPQVGKRYRAALDALQDDTGWVIQISTNPVQNEILRLARELCREHGLSVKKGPGLRQDEGVVKIELQEPLTETAAADIDQQLRQQTGYTLRCQA